MAEASFGTAINCIDGRVQEPVAQWMRQTLGVTYVDAITEPGPDKALTQGTMRQLEGIRDRLAVSLTAHKSVVVAVVGHHDCRGNPVSRERHLELIKKSLEVVASWGVRVRLLGLWVNEQWAVEVVADTAQAAR